MDSGRVIDGEELERGADFEGGDGAPFARRGAIALGIAMLMLGR